MPDAGGFKLTLEVWKLRFQCQREPNLLWSLRDSHRHLGVGKNIQFQII